jgi:hypothetical protein
MKGRSVINMTRVAMMMVILVVLEKSEKEHLIE